MPIRKTRLTRPEPNYAPGPASATRLRDRAEKCRAKADELESALLETQDHFSEAFATADAQRSTRDRISDEARRGRKLGARGVR